MINSVKTVENEVLNVNKDIEKLRIEIMKSDQNSLSSDSMRSPEIDLNATRSPVSKTSKDNRIETITRENQELK